MDTNQFAVLVSILEESQKHSASVSNGSLLQFGVLLLASLAPLIAAFSAYWSKKAVSNTETAKVAGAMAANAATQTAVSVEKINEAVNSDRDKMVKELQDLRVELLNLTRDKIELEKEIAEFIKRKPK